MKIPNKRELQQIAFNHSSDIDFITIFKNCTAKPFSFLVIDATLASNNTGQHNYQGRQGKDCF